MGHWRILTGQEKFLRSDLRHLCNLGVGIHTIRGSKMQTKAGAAVRERRARLRAERADALMSACRDEALTQLIGPFGLTPAMFADKRGGNVTTQHNASQDIFAKDSEQYRRDDYDYARAKSEIKAEMVKNGEMSSESFVDAYTGERAPTKRTQANGKLAMNAELDHVVPLKEAHQSGAWMLDEQERTSLSSDKRNLKYTTHERNRAKGAQAPEGVLTAENGCDMRRVDGIVGEARSAVEEHLPTAMDRMGYHGREVALTGVTEAGKNALRRAMGIVLHELVSGAFHELKTLIASGEARERLLEKLMDALARVATRIKDRLGDVLDAALGGGVQGFVSNLLTFLINNLITTSAKVVTMIREGMKGFFDAIRIVISPPPGMAPIEVAREACKIIAGVVTTSLGLVLEKSVEGLVMSVPFLAPIASVVAPAITGALTGIAAALVIYGLDRFFDWLATPSTEELDARIGAMDAQVELMAHVEVRLVLQFSISESFRIAHEENSLLGAALARSEESLAAVANTGSQVLHARSATIAALQHQLEEAQGFELELRELLDARIKTQELLDV